MVNRATTQVEETIPIFETWDGIAKVNLGVTGFKVVATSGVITATVSVKTSLAS